MVLNFWPFKRKSTGADVLEAIVGTAGGSKSGQKVTHKTALEVATVFACTRVIAEGVAQVPLKVFREEGNNKLPAKDHPLYDILHRKPNDLATSFQWRETLCLHTVLTGDSFSFINRGPGGIILEIINLEPAAVNVKESDTIGERPGYFLKDKNGIENEFPAESILHIKGPSWDGVVGLDAVHIAREAIGLSMALEESHSKLHKNGVKAGGLLSVEGELSPEQYEQLSTWLKENYEGSKNAHKTMILDRAAKFTATRSTGVDSQHLETRRFQIEDICRYFRVMPLMVMQSDKAATYASAEQMFLAHVVHTLSPWYERIEQSIDCQLLSDEDRASGYYVKFITQGLLRGALKDTAEYLYKLASIGLITRNEGRSLLEFNPIDGLDEPLTPVNLMPEGEQTNAELS